MFLEHVNMTVADLDRSEAFYCDVLGLEVRWRGTTLLGERAVHIGSDSGYLALFETSEEERVRLDYARVGVNHFGFLVDDLDAAAERARAAGATAHFEADYKPGRRIYFLDPDGQEFELVSYVDVSAA